MNEDETLNRKCWWCNSEYSDSTLITGCLEAHIYRERLCKVCRPHVTQSVMKHARCRQANCRQKIADWITITDKRQIVKASFPVLV